MLTRISIGVAVLMMSRGVAAQSAMYRCVSEQGNRLTRDKHDVRLGEQCTELSAKEAAKIRAETNREPTAAEKAAMAVRAGKMDQLKRCIELGQLLRRVGTTPKQQAWADAIMTATDLPANEQGYIRERRLRIGMTECGVVAALGNPDYGNRTNHAGGRSDQLVYRSKGIYVYTENGIVRSWQE